MERSKTPIKYEVYDINLSYDENCDRGPFFEGPFPERALPKQKIQIFDFELNSRLGIAAGPLLNSKWIKVYGKLDFDILTYKTVRSVSVPSHPAPNCLYVDAQKQLHLADAEHDIFVSKEPKFIEDLAITNSFGVPSKSPEMWMRDRKSTRLNSSHIPLSRMPSSA